MFEAKAIAAVVIINVVKVIAYMPQAILICDWLSLAEGKLVLDIFIYFKFIEPRIELNLELVASTVPTLQIIWWAYISELSICHDCDVVTDIFGFVNALSD